jgi:acetyl-CoA carboxylase biotin carboxyl carrier protein
MPRPFDVQTVKYLVRLMSRHDLSEIDLREGDKRIRLARGPRGLTTTYAQPMSMPAMPAPAVGAPPAALSTAPAKPEKKLLEIKSETPGTFYASASPGADPFVRVGSKVTPTTVVCLIEAMKLHNQIEAGCSGVIAEILVENQQPVEYNQVLFRVDPAG